MKLNRLFLTDDVTDDTHRPAESLTPFGSQVNLAAEHHVRDFFKWLLEQDPNACIRDAELLFFSHLQLEAARRILMRRRERKEFPYDFDHETKKEG